MNFYKHHLGDYAAATAHLSWDEDCAYRRLMDQYYKREAPIPPELRDACRLARATTPAQRRAVETVLREFFTLADDGWHQKRCDAELAQANAQAETNRRIAEEREARKRARIEHESLHGSGNEPSTNRSPATMGEREPSQTPDSRLQTPEEKKNPPTPKGADEPAGFARFWRTWPSGERKGGKAKCLELWRRAKLEPDADLIVAHVEAMKGTAKWREDGGAYVPAPTTYLNGRRWDGAELNGHAADNFAGAL